MVGQRVVEPAPYPRHRSSSLVLVPVLGLVTVVVIVVAVIVVIITRVAFLTVLVVIALCVGIVVALLFAADFWGISHSHRKQLMPPLAAPHLSFNRFLHIGFVPYTEARHACDVWHTATVARRV